MNSLINHFFIPFCGACYSNVGNYTLTEVTDWALMLWGIIKYRRKGTTRKSNLFFQDLNFFNKLQTTSWESTTVLYQCSAMALCFCSSPSSCACKCFMHHCLRKKCPHLKEMKWTSTCGVVWLSRSHSELFTCQITSRKRRGSRFSPAACLCKQFSRNMCYCTVSAGAYGYSFTRQGSIHHWDTNKM